MGHTFVTEIELAALAGVFVVKDAVGPGASGVDAGLRFLDELSLAAIDTVGQDAPLLVTVGVVEKEAVFTKLGSGDVVLADVVQVALLGVGKQPVGLWTLEGEG